MLPVTRHLHKCPFENRSSKCQFWSEGLLTQKEELQEFWEDRIDNEENRKKTWVLSDTNIKEYAGLKEEEKERKGLRDSRVAALHAANQGGIPGTPYGSLTARSDPKAQSQEESLEHRWI